MVKIIYLLTGSNEWIRVQKTPEMILSLKSVVESAESREVYLALTDLSLVLTHVKKHVLKFTNFFGLPPQTIHDLFLVNCPLKYTYGGWLIFN